MRQRIEGPTKKLSVILGATLHSRAKRFALMNDVTLTDLIVTALEDRLAADSGNRLTFGGQTPLLSKVD
jgi:hypothetical protein